MRITFTDEAWEEYLYWQQFDKKILKKINELIKDICRQPFEGDRETRTFKIYFTRMLVKKNNRRTSISL